MIYFYYGEDTFLNTVMTKKLVDNFVAAQKSDLNVSVLDGEKLTSEVFASQVFALPFLGDKRLIVIKDFLLGNKDKNLKKNIVDYLEKIPDSNDVVFSEKGTPDQREAIFKKLKEVANVKVFNEPSDSELQKFIQGKFKKEGFFANTQTVMKIAYSIGPDIWRLKNELEKLINYVSSCGRKEITVSDVDAIIEPNNYLKVFDLTDALVQKNEKKAIQSLDKLIKNGENELQILSLIGHQIRSMIILKDLASLKFSGNLAAETGLHPFVVKKLSASIRNFDFKFLVDKYSSLSELDWKIKTGQIEARLALDLFIVEFSK